VPAPAWRVARRLLDRATLYKPPVGDDARAALESAYREDGKVLEELLGRRLQLEL
jgi:hypothetical protein